MTLVVLVLTPALPSLLSSRQSLLFLAPVGFAQAHHTFPESRGLLVYGTHSASCVQSHSHLALQRGPRILTVEMCRYPASSQLPHTSSSSRAKRASLAKEGTRAQCSHCQRVAAENECREGFVILGKQTPGL